MPLLYGPDGKPILPSEDREQLRKPHIPQPKPQEKAKNPAKPAHRHIPAIWKIIVYWAGVVSTVVGIYSAFPKVSVTPSENPWNQNDPLSSPLTVSNNGTFGVYSVHLQCQIDYIYDDKMGASTSNISFGESPDFAIGDLSPGGYSNTFCSNPSMITTRDRLSVHLQFVVRFRPSFWPKEIKRVFPARAQTDDKGNIHWIMTSK